MLAPCPASNPRCSNGGCILCLIPAIDNDQRTPMRCQTCHEKTNIQEYSAAIGLQRHILTKKIRPELVGIAFPVHLPPDVDVAMDEALEHEIPADIPPAEVGPSRILCPGVACQPEREYNLDYLVNCQPMCDAVYHAYCLLVASRGENLNGSFTCERCTTTKTYQGWFDHVTNGNNFYNIRGGV